MYAILAGLLLGSTPEPLAAVTPTADAGEVRTGPPLTRTFTLAHRGPDGAVLITGVEAGCGCLKPTVSRTALRPGETADVALTVNTLTQPPGPNAWRVVVRYRVTPPGDSPAPPPVGPDRELELKLTATLVQEVSVTPPVVAFSTEGTAAQTITVTDRRPNPLTVRSAATTNPHLTAVVRPAASANGVRTQTVELAVAAGFPVGRSDETLVLTTDDPGCPELRVPVTAVKRKPGAVVPTPEAAAVRFGRGQEEASALVQLRRPGGGELRIERVECDHPAVRPRWSADPGPVVTVRATVDGSKAAGRPGQSELRVVLAVPAGEVVVVPVRWEFP